LTLDSKKVTVQMKLATQQINKSRYGLLNTYIIILSTLVAVSPRPTSKSVKTPTILARHVTRVDTPGTLFLVPSSSKVAILLDSSRQFQDTTSDLNHFAREETVLAGLRLRAMATLASLGDARGDALGD
jgi:hypothetical protein